jgi:hypothetical protein
MRPRTASFLAVNSTFEPGARFACKCGAALRCVYGPHHVSCYMSLPPSAACCWQQQQLLPPPARAGGLQHVGWRACRPASFTLTTNTADSRWSEPQARTNAPYVVKTLGKRGVHCHDCTGFDDDHATRALAREGG